MKHSLIKAASSAAAYSQAASHSATATGPQVARLVNEPETVDIASAASGGMRTNAPALNQSTDGGFVAFYIRQHEV